jgi:IS30 family transposase
MMGRDPSTIGRELRRNGLSRGATFGYHRA